MVDLSPKLNLLYYKNIIDCVLRRFVSENNNSFTKVGDDYVFSKSMTRSKLLKSIKNYVVDEIRKYTSEYSVLNPNHYFLIGSCFPKDNILLSHASESKYFPEKLKKLINRPDNLKYILREKDIKIDIEMFNHVLEDIFVDFFRCNGKMKNIHFIKHNRIDCYTLYRIIKNEYGASNVVNLHKKFMKGKKSAIYSINEMIDVYIHNKKEIVKTNELRFIRSEVLQFVNESLRVKNG